MSYKLVIGNYISWVFGLLVLAIGIVNIGWGNDLGFGIFLVLLAFVFFPPVTALVREKTGMGVPWLLKVVLGIFIIWAALGVGELFDKIDLMTNDLK